MIFVITGPSGCGKSTLVKEVMNKVNNLQFSVSHTTRKKRSSEKEGEDYYFVSEKEFQHMIKENRLVEWALVHGHYYGTSREELEKRRDGRCVLLDIDVQGAQKIKKKIKKGVFVFIIPPTYQELKTRLEKRGQESREDIIKRLKVAKKEIRYYSSFDYIIINDNLEKAVEELKSVIISRRCALDIQQKYIKSVLQSFIQEN